MEIDTSGITTVIGEAVEMQEGVEAHFAGVIPRTMWISTGGTVFLRCL